MDGDEIKEFIKKNQKAIGIGLGVVVLIAVFSPDETPNGGGGQGGDPYGGGGQGGGPYVEGPQAPAYPAGGGGGGGSGDDGGFDMDKWREDQRRDDERQRQEVEVIRETQRCVDSDTGEVVELPADYPCE